jgi:hypothetical protein
MQKEVEKLASEHNLTIEQTLKYYMMGGYEHADYLCSLVDIGMPDCIIEMENQNYWTKKNKELWKEIEQL